MKQIVFRIDEELAKKAKIKAVKEDKNMTQYLTDLIEKDLETKKEQTQ